MLSDTMPTLSTELTKLDAWHPASDSKCEYRDGADVADLTGGIVLDAWPDGMRIIVRRECPRPSAQLRFSDVDRYRLTVFGGIRKVCGRLTWKPGTGAGPGTRIGSESRRVPGWSTSHSTSSTRIGLGERLSHLLGDLCLDRKSD